MVEVTLADLVAEVRRLGGDPAATVFAVEDGDGFVECRDGEYKIFRNVSGFMVIELANAWECEHADYDDIIEERDEQAVLLVRAKEAAENLVALLGEG